MLGPSVQFSSVAQLCLILCNPMNRSTPGLPIHHQLPESTQTHVHCVKSLLQHHSSKASILRCSAFFIVQLSHPYMTTGKTIALTRRTFVGKVMSLFFNMLPRLVITFLPRRTTRKDKAKSLLWYSWQLHPL